MTSNQIVNDIFNNTTASQRAKALERAGLGVNSFYQWRKGVSPSYDNLMAVLVALGWATDQERTVFELNQEILQLKSKLNQIQELCNV